MSKYSPFFFRGVTMNLLKDDVWDSTMENYQKKVETEGDLDGFFRKARFLLEKKS